MLFSNRNVLTIFIPILTVLSLVTYIFVQDLMLIYVAISLSILIFIHQFFITMRKESFIKREKSKKEVEANLLLTINQNIINTYYWIESIYKMLQNLEQYLTNEISSIKESINKIIDNIPNVIESKLQSIQVKTIEKQEEKIKERVNEEKISEKKIEEKVESKVETKPETKENEKKIESRKVEETQGISVQEIVNIQEITKELVNDIIQLRNEIRRFLSKIKTEQSFDVEHL